MKYLLLGIGVLTSIGCASSTYYYQDGKKQKLTPIDNISRSNNSYDYYKVNDKTKVGVDNTILIKFKNTQNLESYAKSFNFKVLEEIMPKLYKIQVSDRSKTIDTANRLYELDDVIYAHPNFLKEVKKR